MLAQFAREKLAEGEAINQSAIGYVPAHKTFVDGSEGRQEESVNPDGGVIVYEFELISEVLQWISITLEESSPVGSGSDPHPGLYAHSHALFADGTLVDPNSPPPTAAEFVFMNSQPYARKIEKGFSNQFPDGVYQVVATLARNKFGNIAKISFEYRSLQGGAIGAWAATTTMSHKGHAVAKTRSDWLTRQPCIVVKVN